MKYNILNFYRDIWFEPNNLMGEVLEMYYNMIMLYLIFIFLFLMLTFIFLFNYWASKINIIHYMEFIFFLLPIFLLSLFLTFSMKALYMSEKLFEDLFSFKLMGNQWYWSIEMKNQTFNSYILNPEMNYYLRNIDTSNHIFLPINTPTMILISSQDVIHSMGFLDGGLKVDAVPGRLNTLEMISYNTGILNGFCTELCGPLHAYMPFQVEFII